MKRSIIFALILMTLTASAKPGPQLPEPAVTDRPLNYNGSQIQVNRFEVEE